MKHLLFSALIACAACEPQEAPQIALPVALETHGIAPMITDLGYAVTLSEVRFAIRDLQFTTGGEAHASLWKRLFFSPAHAHPGHYAGGEITGELLGEFLLDFTSEDPQELGLANLFLGRYEGANFTFSRATAAQVGADDPLLGHTAFLVGVAERGGREIHFEVTLDSPLDRALVGAVFQQEIDESTTGTLRLEFHTIDALEGDTLFDGVDFTMLDSGENNLRIVPEVSETLDAYYTILRAFETADQYAITLGNP